MRYILFKFFIILGVVFVLYGQHIPQKGIPYVQNFDSGMTAEFGKIWDIESASNGLVYFAADEGLLEFDGEKWRNFKGSKGNTRSVLVKNDSVLYTGSDLDFGVWRKNSRQEFEYESLYPFKKKASEENEEFWQVYSLDEAVVFVSAFNLYLYLDGQFTKLPAKSRFTTSFLTSKGQLNLVDANHGIYAFTGRALQKVYDFDKNTVEVVGLYSHKGEKIFVSKEKGLFKFLNNQFVPVKSALSDYLKVNNVFSFERINDNFLAFGTILNGVFITDLDGKIVQHLNKNKGLTNNTVLSMYADQRGMLWMGLDYGISAWQLVSSNTYFLDHAGDFGSTKSAMLHNNNFYLGTNQGLYRKKWSDLNNTIERKSFKLVSGSQGQVWNIEKDSTDLFIGHDKGLFRLQNEKLQRIGEEPGVWTIKKFRKDYLLTGNYNGVSVYKKDQGNWKFVKKLELILGSCNQIVIEDDYTIWVHIPNYGVIRVGLDDAMNTVNREIFKEEGFKGKLPSLQKSKDSIKVITHLGAYTFLPSKKQFSDLRPIYDFYKYDIKDSKPGYYRPIRINGKFDFFPTQNGFALYNKTKNVSNIENEASLVFRYLEVFNNDLEQVHALDRNVPCDLNNVRFTFIAPFVSNVKYSYRLDGYSSEWSAWSDKNSAEFVDLGSGNYTLEVKAIVNGEPIKTNLKVDFAIAYPWYTAWYAWVVYFLLTLVGIYFFRKWDKLRLLKQKKILLEKQRQSLNEQSEKYKRKVLLERQKQLEENQNILKKNLREKTVELANQAKENQDKLRLMTTLREKVSEIEEDPKLSKKRLGEMRRLLDAQQKKDSQTFEIQMDELHQAFFKRLKKSYPKLSVYDLRLSAYLKIGLNSKEIADIMQVLPSSINVSRSRLRKKLGLDSKDDLFEFLNQLDKKE